MCILSLLDRQSQPVSNRWSVNVFRVENKACRQTGANESTTQITGEVREVAEEAVDCKDLAQHHRFPADGSRRWHPS